MKKEYKDLTQDEKQVYLLSRGLTIDLPYTIALIPFAVIGLITTSKYVGIVCIAIIIMLSIGYFLDSKVLKKAHGMD